MPQTYVESIGANCLSSHFNTIGPHALEHTAAPTAVRPEFSLDELEKAGHRFAGHSQHQRCVECESQGRPGGPGRPIERQDRRGNRRRRIRRRGAAVALERRMGKRIALTPEAVGITGLPHEPGSRAKTPELRVQLARCRSGRRGVRRLTGPVGWEYCPDRLAAEFRYWNSGPDRAPRLPRTKAHFARRAEVYGFPTPPASI